MSLIIKEKASRRLIVEMLMLIVTEMGYPFGGGEAYMYQTAHMNARMGIKTVWLCFVDKFCRPYTETRIEQLNQNILIIQQAGGWNIQVVGRWVRFLQPQLVHTQGSKSAELCNIPGPLLVGVHFWTNFVDLSPDTGNRAILANIEKHSLAKTARSILDRATVYLASEFVQDVIYQVGGIKIDRVLYPVSSETCMRTDAEARIAKYCTLINCHRLKGGDLLLALAGAGIPCLGVQTEPGSEILDAELARTCVVWPHTPDVSRVYAVTRVLIVPSRVDETFGRVVVEAMMNGIPVLTSGAGYLGYFFHGRYPGLILDPDKPDDWVREVWNLLRDSDWYTSVSAGMRDLYAEFYSHSLVSYRQILVEAVRPLKVMLFVPWSQQGLGVQGRRYAEILDARGIGVCVFSFASYRGGHPQSDPTEWARREVYYSDNHREKVTNQEIEIFVRQYRPTVAIIPETVYDRVFEIATLLRTLLVRTIAVPNIEIVRNFELMKHHCFDMIMFNNRLCQRVFESHGVMGKYVGYGLGGGEERDPKQDLHFLCLGGLNAFTRKNVDQVAQAFSQARFQRPARLTVTIQSGPDTAGMDRIPTDVAGLEIISQPLSMKQVAELYKQATWVIQVSRHEGLGLGFFEAIANGLPCLTLDVPPHNEIIEVGMGILVPARLIAPTENPNSLVTEAVFETTDLARGMEMAETAVVHVRERGMKNTKAFEVRFIKLCYQSNPSLIPEIR